MNRMTHDGPRSMDRALVELFGVLTFGAASIASQDCLGFSVARTGQGAFTITLEDKFTSLFGVDATYLHASTLSGGKLELVAVDLTGAKTITCKWVSDDTAGGTFAAEDPASGAKLYLRLTLRDSSVPRKGV
jgi:hypothetical protein